MKVIYGGHWDNPPEGWVSIPEDEQDLTLSLKQTPDSLDCIFTEHVGEHLSMNDCIWFMRESLKCLKKGGVFRIAMPCIDKIIQLKNDTFGKHYSDIQTKHYYPNEDSILKELGLEGVREEPIAFMMDSLFKGHHHKFIWTSELCKKVLQKVGYSEVYVQEPGETNFNKEYCLERVLRGANEDYLRKEFKIKSDGVIKFDPETMVIEAKK
jgi:hypothetical protein